MLMYPGSRTKSTKRQMTAWNAWRYPTFYIGPKYALAEFTFKPPHTLFVDASLQVMCFQ